MSGEQAPSSSVVSKDDSDDISLTFWICLWAVLAITASWIYTKLNGARQGKDASRNNIDDPEAHERIARKLVNEISKNDLVKRSTFRRQRSYEIIDGEVRIHYDVSSYDSCVDDRTTDDTEDIMGSAEVKDFPIRRTSMDEMELILPGNLPRIIEEGEDELANVAPERTNPLRSEDAYQVSHGQGKDIPVISIQDYDEEQASSRGDLEENELREDRSIINKIESGDILYNYAAMEEILTKPPKAEQINDTPKIAKARREKDSATQGKNCVLSNDGNSSIDNLYSSSSEESVIENLPEAQIFSYCDDGKDKSSHTSDSTTSSESVYKVTEVTAGEGDSFTVTRRAITRIHTTEGSDFKSQQTSCGKAEEHFEHFKYECQIQDETNDSNGDMTVKNDISYHSGIHVEKLQIDSGDSFKSSNFDCCKKETLSGDKGITSAADMILDRCKQRNVHEPEVVQSMDRKFDECSTIYKPAFINNVQHAGHSDKQKECAASEKSSLPKVGGFSESTEDESYTLHCLDDSDLLIDNSGDVLFKVIGPSQDEFLGDIDEDEECATVEDIHLTFDENENYQMFTPEVELSKSWKSLPSWEKVHRIHHRDIDRDADDSDIASSGDEQLSASAEQERLQMVKSEELMAFNKMGIFKEDHLDSKVNQSLHRQVSPDNAKSFTPKNYHLGTIMHDVPDITEIVLAEMVKSNELGQQSLDPVGVEQEEEDIGSLETTVVVKEEASNLTESENVVVQVRSQKINSNSYLEQDMDVVINLVEQSQCAVTREDDQDQEIQTDETLENPKHTNYFEIDKTTKLENTKLVKGIEVEDDQTLAKKEEKVREVNCKLTKADKMSDCSKLTKTKDVFQSADQLVKDELKPVTSESRKTHAKTSVIKDEPKVIEDVKQGNFKETKKYGLMSAAVDATEDISNNEDVSDADTDKIKHSSPYSDENIIVAYPDENEEQIPEVIFATEVAEQETIPPVSYSVTSCYEVKKFKETSLDSVPLTLSPLRREHFAEHLRGSQSPFHEGTDIDSFSDVNETDIGKMLPRDSYNKSKSVTDLDQALASYEEGLQHSMETTQGDKDRNCTTGLSKSVPDILDICQEESLKETAVKSNSNTLVDSLTGESLQRKNLSVSSPEITSGLKKITKIKIVHVKFLEMQGESGSENIEEDSFTVEGIVPISGKMKRRSRNMSSDQKRPVTSHAKTSPAVSPGVVDEHFTAEKNQEKQLEFGFDDLFNNMPSAQPSVCTVSTGTEARQNDFTDSLQPRIQSNIYSSSGPPTAQGRYVARYGVIPVQSSRPHYTQNIPPAMKLSEKFQMPQEPTSQQRSKPAPPSYHEAQQRRKYFINTKTSNCKSARHSGRFVTVKGGVVNDYECSSDADSETSYNSPTPHFKTRKVHRMVVRSDSASSSEPDSPRARVKQSRTSMHQLFGVEDDQHSQLKHVGSEKQGYRSTLPESKLFSRFGHVHQDPGEMEGHCSQDRDKDDAWKRNRSPIDDHHAREMLIQESDRNMEFSPLPEVEHNDRFQPFERCHSPTSISSDQSSVFSFNCDFDPMPAPSSSFQPEVYTCENPTCRKQDILLGPEKTSYKSCPACFTYYCCSQCRKLHWPAHKQSCYFGRVNTYVRSIIRLCQRRQDLSMYLSQLARDGHKQKGRGVVMATFSSPELAREFITKGHDAFSGRKPTYSSLAELNREGIISKHRVALMQAVRDYEPNEEFVFNIAVVAVHDIPITPAPRYKLNTVLHCIKMPLNEKIVARQPKEAGKVETRLFALPKCARHEFVNEMEARRHYCRNLSKNLRLYNIRLKDDYQECYKKLCMYVEHDISFEPMTVCGQRNGLTYKCIIAPEQSYPLNAEYC